MPVVEALVPAPDPWDAARRLAGWSDLLFLDSSAPLPHLGRFSFVCARPFLRLRSTGGNVTVATPSRRLNRRGDPFLVLQKLLRRYRSAPVPGLPPFQGGAAGLFGYDLCRHIEKVPKPLFADFSWPDLAVNFYGWVLAFDHQTGGAWLITTGFPRRELRAFQALAQRRQHWVLAQLDQKPPRPRRFPRLAAATAAPAPSYPVPGQPGLFSNFSAAQYQAVVARAIKYIHAGDCFQVNIAQRLFTPLRDHPLSLYGRLRAGNPAPFAAYFDLGHHAIVSASPERFLRLDQGQVQTRPIKGTRPRGQTPGDDLAAAAELLASAKDRAENVMIVDLLRNDLGRVCDFGSVKVKSLCQLESYRFVHHLVSGIEGRLRPGLDAIDLLRAAFPGGSVTGAPKVRAMEIISELEQTARGPYCGCLGYLGFDGGCDTNLLIRTMVLGGGLAQFSVGGGIVADSEPRKEYEETWHKAQGLLQALFPARGPN